MTSAQVVETSVKVTTNSPSQDYTHPDDHNLRTYYFSVGVETIVQLSIEHIVYYMYSVFVFQSATKL